MKRIWTLLDPQPVCWQPSADARQAGWSWPGAFNGQLPNGGDAWQHAWRGDEGVDLAGVKIRRRADGLWEERR